MYPRFSQGIHSFPVSISAKKMPYINPVWGISKIRAKIASFR
jgi:hypothetical protein